MPGCVEALRLHRKQQKPGTSLLFASAAGTPLDAANVRRAFRRVVATAGR